MVQFLTIQQAEVQPFETEYRYPVITSLMVFLVTAAISIGAVAIWQRPEHAVAFLDELSSTNRRV